MSEQGIKSLDNHLSSASYIRGFQPSQADTTAFRALAEPPASRYCHVTRWYKHVASHGKDVAYFPGAPISLVDLGFECSEAGGSNKDDDDDFELFGSNEEEDEEVERLKEERLQEYAKRKAKKATVIAKSNIILDVKPWDDETDMKILEECVRSVQTDGLLWGISKLVPLAYGIKKLQITCVVEDDKVGTDFLEEEILKYEEYIQSVDIAAFNKI